MIFLFGLFSNIRDLRVYGAGNVSRIDFTASPWAHSKPSVAHGALEDLFGERLIAAGTVVEQLVVHSSPHAGYPSMFL